MTTSKIRIKMGPIEVEYEGSENFLKEELSEILASVSKLYRESSDTTAAQNTGSNAASADGETGRVVGTTATIAARLKVKSAPELLMAAAAHLSLVVGKSEFTRQELLEQMKGATGYFKESHTRNLTQSISSQVRAGSLLEPSTGKFALSAKKRAELETNLVS